MVTCHINFCFSFSFGDVISSRVSDKVESSKPGRSKGKVGGGPIYLKKSLQAGIIICEIEVKSPFFSTKLIIFESSRFKGSRPFVNFNVSCIFCIFSIQVRYFYRRSTVPVALYWQNLFRKYWCIIQILYHFVAMFGCIV